MLSLINLEKSFKHNYIQTYLWFNFYFTLRTKSLPLILIIFNYISWMDVVIFFTFVIYCTHPCTWEVIVWILLLLCESFSFTFLFLLLRFVLVFDVFLPCFQSMWEPTPRTWLQKRWGNWLIGQFQRPIFHLNSRLNTLIEISRKLLKLHTYTFYCFS